jgi:hypothetical protein
LCLLRSLQVTLPSRFIAKTAHLIAVLTVYFDVQAVVSQMENYNPNTGVSGSVGGTGPTALSSLSAVNDRKTQ